MSPTLGREHDFDEEHIHGHNQKKSVLTKVKEKAKKLRHTLSSKKKHNEDGTGTPTWGVTLEDDDEFEVEDAEYLGAPSNIIPFISVPFHACLFVWYFCVWQFWCSDECDSLKLSHFNFQCMNRSWHQRDIKRMQGSIREQFQ